LKYSLNLTKEKATMENNNNSLEKALELFGRYLEDISVPRSDFDKFAQQQGSEIRLPTKKKKTSAPEKLVRISIQR
jgi:uncharacterized protein (UPF0147 family)